MDEILKNPSHYDLIDSIKKNSYFNLWKTFIPDICKIINKKNYTLIDTGIPLSLNNGVVSFNFTRKDLEEDIQSIINYFKSRELGFIWITHFDSNPNELENKLVKYGFKLRYTESGMTLDINTLREDLILIKDIDIIKVENIPNLREFCKITVEAFKLPRHFCYPFLLNLPINNEKLKLFLGIYQDKPIAVGLVAFMNGVAAIHNVATLEDFRDKGIATAILLSIIQEVKKMGYKISVLQASEKGFSIYEKIGFKKHSLLKIYEYPFK